MNKLKKLVLGAFILLPVEQSFGFNEQSILVDNSNFTALSTHLTNHAVPSAHHIALIIVSGAPQPCSNGYFYNTENNKDAHSMALSAFVSGQRLKVGYDADTNITPWGATNYCAVTQIRLDK